MDAAITAPQSAKAMAEAAQAFLTTLSPEQRRKATFAFEDDERFFWHYTPIPRRGLPRKEMDDRQLEAAEALLASGLTEVGFRQAKAIIEHELILGEVERREGNTRFDRDPGLYFWTVFGDPGGPGPWGWRVEGHHLSVRYTVVDGRVLSPTPSFFGANPAEVLHGPKKGLRILAETEDLARRLLLSLDEAQRRRAVFYPVAPPELLTRNDRRVGAGQPRGLPAELMTADQRETLMTLIRVYVERKPPEVARGAMRRIEAAGLGHVHFAWAGSPYPRIGHYYRVHGPTLFIEYDNTQNNANHIHSVWRDTEGDFGYDILKAHYQQAHAD